MFQNIIIGQYVPGKSVVHRLDPRAKLAAIFLFVIMIFLANSWLAYSVVGLTVALTVLVSRVPLSFIYKGLKPILVIMIFTFILHVFMTKEGEIMFTIGWVDIYKGGLIQGMFISMRLLFLVIITSLLTLTTTPMDLTDALEMILKPFKRIGVPAHELALMMSIALRFIPTLLQEAEKIIKAQMARGANFTTGSIKERAEASISLLIPLFVSSFKRAEDLAVAMESRGYRGGEGRTKLRELHWQFKDTGLIILTVILGIGLFVLRS